MRGLHETIFMFGYKPHKVEDALQGYWDESAEVKKLDSLETIGVHAEEETYGFDVASAFPAILLSLDF